MLHDVPDPEMVLWFSFDIAQSGEVGCAIKKFVTSKKNSVSKIEALPQNPPAMKIQIVLNGNYLQHNVVCI
jgi:hypothetical protein